MKAVLVTVFVSYLLGTLLAFPHKRNNNSGTSLENSNLSTVSRYDARNGYRLPFNWCGFESTKTNKGGRYKRYVLQGSRWKTNPITYTISKYPSPSLLPRIVVDKEIEAAFRMWEDVSNLVFQKRIFGKANIDIRFEKKYHGDDDPFDGRGGMTAHAYYPQFGGNVHFDEDENWTAGSQSQSQGINLFQVATHEIGHALGLEHSDTTQSAVMSPYYINYDANFRMHPDDIEGIQALYGKKSYSVCDDSKIDAATKMIDGATYLFKGNLVFKLQNLSSPVDPGYPKQISKAFDNLYGPLDAVFTRANGITYFFKGHEFWRFSNMKMDVEFPKNVSEFFRNIPTPLDATVVFPGNENIYFIKGHYYWKYDPARSPPVSSEYPKSLSRWTGIPRNVDAALRVEENGIPAVYFFKDNLFWRFNDKAESVYITDPPYPRQTRTLFGCSYIR